MHSAVPVCALCRAPVPQGFVFNPTVVKEVKATEDEFTWYYEGKLEQGIAVRAPGP